MERQPRRRPRWWLYVIALSVVVFFVWYMSHSVEVRPMEKPRQHNRYVKIDENGRYKPYYGYSVVSMGKNQSKMKKIQDYLESNEILRRYVSVLPASSYHVTVFNIYAHARPPVKFVQGWLEGGQGRTLPKDSWIPPQDIFEVMNKAQKYCEEIGQEAFTNIMHGTMGYNVGDVLKVVVDVDTQPWFKMLRQKCSEVFEHDDRALKVSHMTFGYLYRDVPQDEKKLVSREVKKMYNFVHSLGKLELGKPNVMFFDTMESFIPFTEMIKIP